MRKLPSKSEVEAMELDKKKMSPARKIMKAASKFAMAPKKPKTGRQEVQEELKAGKSKKVK